MFVNYPYYDSISTRAYESYCVTLVDHPYRYEYEYEWALEVPKWWKWYDIFRTWAEVKILPMQAGMQNCIKRVQERVSATQRAKQKRRAFVQKLYAA